MLQLIAMSILVLAIGAAFLLAGYRIFHILLPIWSFFVGFWLGAQIDTLLFSHGFLASASGWTMGLAVGLILAVVSYLFYAVGVVMLGGSFGAWIGASMMLLLGFDSGFLVNVAIIITAIIFSALTVILDIKKHLLIIITAMVGSSAMITAALLILGTITMASFEVGGNLLGPVLDTSVIWLFGWLLLAFFGIGFQERTTRGFFLEADRQQTDEGEA